MLHRLWFLPAQDCRGESPFVHDGPSHIGRSSPSAGAAGADPGLNHDAPKSEPGGVQKDHRAELPRGQDRQVRCLGDQQDQHVQTETAH